MILPPTQSKTISLFSSRAFDKEELVFGEGTLFENNTVSNTTITVIITNPMKKNASHLWFCTVRQQQ